MQAQIRTLEQQVTASRLINTLAEIAQNYALFVSEFVRNAFRARAIVVTKPVSEELDKVLDTFAPDFNENVWTENFREAVEQRRAVFRTNPRKYNTLVQICWKLNY